MYVVCKTSLKSTCGFQRGFTYYEFTNEVENILNGKEVLLQDRTNTTQWFKVDKAKVPPDRRLKLYGEGIARSTFGEKYRVFIQSFGSGARHIPRGSWILYNHSDDQVVIIYSHDLISYYELRPVLNVTKWLYLLGI